MSARAFLDLYLESAQNIQILAIFTLSIWRFHENGVFGDCQSSRDKFTQKIHKDMYSNVLQSYRYFSKKKYGTWPIPDSYCMGECTKCNDWLHDRLVGFYKNAPNKVFLWFNWFLNTNIITFIWARKHIKLSLNCLYPTETVYLPLTTGKIFIRFEAWVCIPIFIPILIQKNLSTI